MILKTKKKKCINHPLKEYRCKFKIDKINYSKSQCRTTYYFTKNEPSVYP